MKIILPALTALILATPALALAQGGTEATAASSMATAENATVLETAVKPAKKKLRFRDRGPACMCAGGLTEKDIKAGRSDNDQRQRLEPRATPVETQDDGLQP